MSSRISAFLAERLPLKDVENHIKKPLPKHINWLFSLGSMAAFLLIPASCYRGVFSVLLFAFA